ncbi:ATP-binding protein [Bdellovibrio sp. HCB337]|uniref:ATP-binding protein n=1 Tax=Bdellovibrio sp. HCB337 TaxID=3394358 RepID=UPI0039A4C346
MKLKSLVRENNSLVPVEVEVTLLPGLPTIQFLGLPDQIIKESIHRIKSAIRQQDFDFPKAQQVFVNIRPNHLKKSSRGIELAVAAGILWETGQMPAPSLQNNFYIYGELGLMGEVFEPEDLASDFETDENTQVLTGTLSSVCCPFARRVVTELKQIPQARFHEPEMKSLKVQRPQEGLSLKFSEEHAQILSLAALGGHSLLLAGPSGSGKSTIAKTLASLMAEPRPEEILEIKKIHKDLHEGDDLWRPVINPHHSSTPLALIGGGVPPRPGEISRAHRGLLILDELLEFDGKVQEGLREPMEEGALRLSRGSRAVRFPAMAQVISTTNLCPCGDFTPGCRPQCRFSITRCKSYSQKLSGPLVDRFEILFFTEKRKRGEENLVTGHEILEDLETSRAWLREQGRGDVLNSRRPVEELEAEVDSFYFKHLMNKDLGSQRRYQATLRVARTLADLDKVEIVQGRHIDEALRITWVPFERLKRWD